MFYNIYIYLTYIAWMFLFVGGEYVYRCLFFFSGGGAEWESVRISGPGIRCYQARKHVPERLLALFLMKRTNLRPALQTKRHPWVETWNKKNTIFVLMGGLNPMFVCKMWIWNFGALNSTLTLDFSQQPKVDCKLEIYKYDNYISRCPCKHLFMWQKTSILGPKSSCHIPTTARQQPWQQRSDEKKKNTHSWRRQNFTDVWLTMGSKQNHG